MAGRDGDDDAPVVTARRSDGLGAPPAAAAGASVTAPARGDPRHVPGRLPALWWLRAASYYLHVGLATLVLGAWGLPLALTRGRAGAQRVATVWIGYMLAAARWHYGVRVEVRGKAPDFDCIVAAKHQSFLDILAIAHACPSRAFVMKKEIMNVPIMGWFAREVGSVPIDRARGRDARAALVAAVRVAMARGGLGQLIVYPEGTRTRPGERRRWKGGVGVLYEQTGLPCQPVATNAGMFWPRGGARIRPGIAVIEFLPQVAPGLTPEALMARIEPEVEAASDALMSAAGLRLPAR